MKQQKKKVLLLEDDPNLGFILQEHLQLEDYDVTLCVNGALGLKAYRRGEHILCLVDVMMPTMDGFTFVKTLRETDDTTPVTFLTAKSLKEDKVEGFRIGCDDYVTKPFSMEELMLRIHAVLRRTQPSSDPDEHHALNRFTIGRFVFDTIRQVLTSGPSEHKLTGREAELLRMLCLHQNRVLERDIALKAIWGSDTFFNGRSMDVFISRLRRYLAADDSVQILNVHGRGFKLFVEEEDTAKERRKKAGRQR